MKNVSTTTTAADYADIAIDGDPEVDLYAYALIVSVRIRSLLETQPKTKV